MPNYQERLVTEPIIVDSDVELPWRRLLNPAGRLIMVRTKLADVGILARLCSGVRAVMVLE